MRRLFNRIGRSIWLLPITVVLACLPISGCGSRAYETRLQETVNYFDYLAKRNQNLKEEWRGSGIQIRVPKQFELMPAPRKPSGDKADGNSSPRDEPQQDTRQPAYLDFEIPGLVAAWKALVDVDDHDAKVPAYIYIASNYPLWATTNGAKHAPHLHEDVATQLAGALGKQLPNLDEWKGSDFPPRGKKGYVSRKAYTTITFTPDRPIHGAITDFGVYLYKVKEIQIVLLTVIPREISRRENIRQRIAFCLETLTASGQKPSRAGGHSPSSGSPVGF